jgi:2'-5' RNA ligase
MSKQFFLPGFESSPEPAPPTDNVFLALVPSAAMVKAVGELTRELRRDHGLRGKAVAPSCLHVSLHGLGAHHGVPPGLTDAVSAAVSPVSMPPFDIRFDRALSFTNKRAARPFVLRAGRNMAALNVFHRALGEAVTRTGLGCWVTRHFTPHMTLLYDRQLVEEQAIEPLSWTVTEFVLVHSFVGEGRHDHLARWPLRG